MLLRVLKRTSRCASSMPMVFGIGRNQTSIIQNPITKSLPTISQGDYQSKQNNQTPQSQVSGGRSILSREPLDPQKAISLPSSPKNYRGQSYERNGSSHRNISYIWDKVLGSPMFQNKPLLPHEEWNIDFSELTVGIRVGIGFFGEVFRGVWNGTDVAIKLFLEQDLTAENMEDFCNERYRFLADLDISTVVYAVAYEGARLEIPEGPLGKLIEDCWREPEQRPSCSDILSRLLDCEYALC